MAAGSLIHGEGWAIQVFEPQSGKITAVFQESISNVKIEYIATKLKTSNFLYQSSFPGIITTNMFFSTFEIRKIGLL